jgi:hypothetical protein
MIVKVFLLAALLVFAVLLAWAFQSRGMPALQVGTRLFCEPLLTLLGSNRGFQKRAVSEANGSLLKRVVGEFQRQRPG